MRLLPPKPPTVSEPRVFSSILFRRQLWSHASPHEVRLSEGKVIAGHWIDALHDFDLRLKGKPYVVCLAAVELFDGESKDAVVISIAPKKGERYLVRLLKALLGRT